MDYGDFDDGNGRYFFKINVAEFGMKDTIELVGKNWTGA